ncbi:MAG TPA: MBL fold metallo-hydrolase [Opitutaceae bacterium]|nr:MBL fold metallo-hydrolase [Opitutaceae bacterium]
MTQFSRREMLRFAGLGAGLALLPSRLPAQPALAAAPAALPLNTAFYRFRIGAFEAAAFVTGFMGAEPSQPFYAPQASEAEFRAAVAAAAGSKGRMHFNALLLRRGAETILIDAGPGGKVPDDCDLVANLARLGVAPADVTRVVLTHAHFDHCGGLLDADGRAVFSRAEHCCLAEEIAFWTAPQPDLTKLRMNPEWVLGPARRVFEKIAFTRLETGVPFAEGITPLLSPGHTPGHMTLRIESQGEALYHIADLTHNAHVMLPHPDWTIGSDCDEPIAAATRKRIFAELAANGARVFGSHTPFPGLGRIVALSGGGEQYRWVPEDWAPVG